MNKKKKTTQIHFNVNFEDYKALANLKIWHMTNGRKFDYSSVIMDAVHHRLTRVDAMRKQVAKRIEKQNNTRKQI